jgi:hypothetical protein
MDDDDLQADSPADVMRRYWQVPEKRKLLVGVGAAVLLVIGAIIAAPSYEDSKKAVARANTEDCDEHFPKHNTHKIFEPRWMKATITHTEWQIDNRTGLPLWIKLLDPNYEKPLLGMMVYPGEVGVANIPIGQYKAEFRAGKWWCNANTEITDAPAYKITNDIRIAGDSVSQIRIVRDNVDKMDATIVSFPKGSGRMVTSSETVVLKQTPR